MYVCVFVCIYVCVRICMCGCVCTDTYVYFLRSGFSSLSFLFCVPYSCLRTVSLELDVQTLKPPSARPRTGKYVRVGTIKKKTKQTKKTTKKNPPVFTSHTGWTQ